MRYTNGTSALKSFPDDLIQETGFEVSEQPQIDNMGDPVDVDKIRWEWKTTSQVAEIHGMTRQAVTYLCQNKFVRAVFYRNRWYIEPQSALDYQKSGRTGRPPDKD